MPTATRDQEANHLLQIAVIVLNMPCSVYIEPFSFEFEVVWIQNFPVFKHRSKTWGHNSNSTCWAIILFFL